jgi:AcrR family transcriptional regulator
MGQKLTLKSTKLRREEEKILRKEEIKKTALSLFSKKGYSETKMEEIAEKAMLSKGLLYFYFKSKEELLEEILKDIYRDLPFKLKRIKESKSDPIKKLKDFIKTEFEFYSKNKKITKLLIELYRIKKCPDFFKKIHEKEKETLKEILEECVRKGRIKDYGIDLLSLILSSIFHYSFLTKNKIKNEKDIFNLFLKGVKK